MLARLIALALFTGCSGPEPGNEPNDEIEDVDDVQDDEPQDAWPAQQEDVATSTLPIEVLDVSEDDGLALILIGNRLDGESLVGPLHLLDLRTGEQEVIADEASTFGTIYPGGELLLYATPGDEGTNTLIRWSSGTTTALGSVLFIAGWEGNPRMTSSGTHAVWHGHGGFRQFWSEETGTQPLEGFPVGGFGAVGYCGNDEGRVWLADGTEVLIPTHTCEFRLSARGVAWFEYGPETEDGYHFYDESGLQSFSLDTAGSAPNWAYDDTVFAIRDDYGGYYENLWLYDPRDGSKTFVADDMEEYFGSSGDFLFFLSREVDTHVRSLSSWSPSTGLIDLAPADEFSRLKHGNGGVLGYSLHESWWLATPDGSAFHGPFALGHIPPTFVGEAAVSVVDGELNLLDFDGTERLLAPDVVWFEVAGDNLVWVEPSGVAASERWQIEFDEVPSVTATLGEALASGKRGEEYVLIAAPF